MVSCQLADPVIQQPGGLTLIPKASLRCHTPPYKHIIGRASLPGVGQFSVLPEGLNPSESRK